MQRCLTRTLFTLGILATVALGSRPAVAGPRPETVYRGKVVTSNQPLAPAGEEAQFLAYLKANNRKTISGAPGSPWQVYFIAFFAKPIGAPMCHVALYDVSNKGHKPEFVEAVGQEVSQPDQRNLASSIELSRDRFKAGHTYELRVTRVVKGKEQIYARTRITLR